MALPAQPGFCRKCTGMGKNKQKRITCNEGSSWDVMLLSFRFLSSEANTLGTIPGLLNLLLYLNPCLGQPSPVQAVFPEVHSAMHLHS